MKKHTLKTAVFASLSSLALASTPLMAEPEPGCSDDLMQVNVEGKIFNNAQPGGNTLGIVTMKTDLFGKMKCGIVGQLKPGQEQPPLGTIPEEIDFFHTISCDDAIAPAPDGTVLHSGLTLDTTGTTEEGPYCTLERTSAIRT